MSLSLFIQVFVDVYFHYLILYGAIYFSLEVSGYPTIKFWKDGSWMEYDGPRDADGKISSYQCLKKSSLISVLWFFSLVEDSVMLTFHTI